MLALNEIARVLSSGEPVWDAPMSGFRTITLAGSLIYSGAVIAQSLGPASGPSWEVIAVGTWGLLTTVVGVVAMTWTAAISTRLKEQDDRLDRLNDMVLREYHDKNELNEVLIPIKAQLEEFSRLIYQINSSVATLLERSSAKGAK